MPLGHQCSEICREIVKFSTYTRDFSCIWHHSCHDDDDNDYGLKKYSHFISHAEIFYALYKTQHRFKTTTTYNYGKLNLSTNIFN